MKRNSLDEISVGKGLKTDIWKRQGESIVIARNAGIERITIFWARVLILPRMNTITIRQRIASLNVVVVTMFHLIWKLRKRVILYTIIMALV